MQRPEHGAKRLKQCNGDKGMICEHIDYDDYFERCNDCGMTGQEIHEAECKDYQLTEDGCCDHCGTILEETKE